MRGATVSETQLCQCLCGQPASEGSLYAGGTENERKPHRTAFSRQVQRAEKAADAAKQAALAHMGLTSIEDVKVQQVGALLASALHEASALGLLLAEASVDEERLEQRISMATAHLELQTRQHTEKIASLEEDLRVSRTAARRAEQHAASAANDAITLAVALTDCEAALAASEQARDEAQGELARCRAELAAVEAKTIAQRAALHAAIQNSARDHGALLAFLSADT